MIKKTGTKCMVHSICFINTCRTHFRGYG